MMAVNFLCALGAGVTGGKLNGEGSALRLYTVLCGVEVFLRPSDRALDPCKLDGGTGVRDGPSCRGRLGVEEGRENENAPAVIGVGGGRFEVEGCGGGGGSPGVGGMITTERYISSSCSIQVFKVSLSTARRRGGSIKWRLGGWVATHGTIRTVGNSIIPSSKVRLQSIHHISSSSGIDTMADKKAASMQAQLQAQSLAFQKIENGA